jgi:hypothetical protein
MVARRTIDRKQWRFQSDGGHLNLGVVSGSGNLVIGNTSPAAGTPLAKVTKFTQSSVTINNGGKLVVTAGLTRYTNDAGGLTLTGNGILDLNHHDLLTTTRVATIRQCLVNGCNGGELERPGGRARPLSAIPFPVILT